MISSDKIGVQILVNQCVANGMKYVVCSPGSRNAPFVIALDEHPEVECLVIHDERSAAFFALGMAQQLNEPVGIVCTSGSAALNYYPAVAEAYYQCIPLVIITADRPAEWVDQGDGQTIVQRDVYKNHIRYSCQFSELIQNNDQQWYIERETALAFAEGNGNWKGPIHFNMSLSEPLYLTKEREISTTRKIDLVKGEFKFSENQKAGFEKILSSSRKLILCGQLNSDENLLQELKKFSKDSSVAVLVENTSNLVDSQFIHCIDRTLNRISNEELKDFQPEVLITIGGAVVSKRIKQFLRDSKPTYHLKIGEEFPFMDTYQSLTHSIQTEAVQFLKEVNSLNYVKNASDFGSKWKMKDVEVEALMSTYFENSPYSDLAVFNEILENIPMNSHLHMANSSVVRYCQLFNPKHAIHYWSNRGTSGIDGSSSTAFGAAFTDQTRIHTLITGDVSFFYDSNAFWNHYLGKNIRVILINNSGGGIFKIIPGPSSSAQLEKYFEAKHDFSAEGICQTFGVEYHKSKDLKELKHELTTFFQSSKNANPKLLEITTPADTNHIQLKEFFEFTKEFSN